MPSSTVNLRNLWALRSRLVTVPRVSARERGCAYAGEGNRIRGRSSEGFESNRTKP